MAMAGDIRWVVKSAAGQVCFSFSLSLSDGGASVRGYELAGRGKAIKMNQRRITRPELGPSVYRVGRPPATHHSLTLGAHLSQVEKNRPKKKTTWVRKSENPEEEEEELGDIEGEAVASNRRGEKKQTPTSHPAVPARTKSSQFLILLVPLLLLRYLFSSPCAVLLMLHSDVSALTSALKEEERAKLWPRRKEMNYLPTKGKTKPGRQRRRRRSLGVFASPFGSRSRKREDEDAMQRHWQQFKHSKQRNRRPIFPTTQIIPFRRLCIFLLLLR